MPLKRKNFPFAVVTAGGRWYIICEMVDGYTKR